MGSSMNDKSTDESRVPSLMADLEDTKQELFITQRNNSRLMEEAGKWKEIAMKAKERITIENEKHKAIMTRLGLKMLHFENELRKEEREIEQRLLQKDKEIRILSKAIDSLQNDLKSNTLCQNCFLMKHHAIVEEHVVKEDNFVAKFPLDMDFADLKNPEYDPRSRSLSLPLNLTSHVEKSKSGTEFCYHHKLSPVPEELESGSLELARKMNEETIVEEEEQPFLPNLTPIGSSTGFKMKKDVEHHLSTVSDHSFIKFEKNVNSTDKIGIVDGYRKLNQEISCEIKSVLNDLIGQVELSLDLMEDENQAQKRLNGKNFETDQGVIIPLHDDLNLDMFKNNEDIDNLKQPLKSGDVSCQKLSFANNAVLEKEEKQGSSRTVAANFPLTRAHGVAGKTEMLSSPDFEIAISELVSSVINSATNEIESSNQGNLTISNQENFKNSDENVENVKTESNQRNLHATPLDCKMGQHRKLHAMENRIDGHQMNMQAYDGMYSGSYNVVNLKTHVSDTDFSGENLSQSCKTDFNSEETKVVSNTAIYQQELMATLHIENDPMQEKQMNENSNVDSDTLIEYDVIELD